MKKHHFLSYVLSFCIGLYINTSSAKVIEKVGSTYPIKEKDLITQMEERASKVDLSKYKEKIKKRFIELATANWDFPPAKERKSFLVDPTYTLPFDIPKVNDKGEIVGILYPKGYTFNPLDYIPFRKKYIIFNGDRKEEVEWFKKNFQKDMLTKPLLSKGNAIKISKEVKRPVYILTKEIQKVFKIEKTPSIVYKYKNPKDGKYYLRVDEIPIPSEK